VPEVMAETPPQPPSGPADIPDGTTGTVAPALTRNADTDGLETAPHPVKKAKRAKTQAEA
jgi:hypothetical protein